jgi:hypothetical protein
MTEYQCTDHVLEWQLPEGKFPGTLIEYGEYHQRTGSGAKKYFRLVFDVEVDGNPYTEYRAQKRYPMGPKLEDKVLKDVKRWLGKKRFEENPNVMLMDLLGEKVTITIKHLQGNGYQKPFSMIKSITPAPKAGNESTQATSPALV